MIYDKLAKIQCALKAPKSQYNAFGKYKYRKCEDILESLKPLLSAEKCVIKLSDQVELIGDRYYIKASATIVDSESGEEISVVGYAREETDKKGMDGSQITGASSSYARKYALNGLFAIDDNADSDDTNNGQTDTTSAQSERGAKASKQDKPIVAQEPSKASEPNKEQHTLPDAEGKMQTIKKLIAGTKVAPTEVAKFITKMFNKKWLRDLTEDEYLQLLDCLETEINQRKSEDNV